MILKEIPSDFNPSREVAGLLAQHEDRSLLLLRSSKSVQGGVWCLVGGTIEPGEPIREGLVREVLEETQISLPPLKPLFIDRYACRIPQYDFYLNVFWDQIDSPDIVINHESMEYEWVENKDLFEDRKFVESGEDFILDIQTYIEQSSVLFKGEIG
jgi:ADP-ribose pyrophosphatase YjhB (NUDIX family)